MVKYLFLICGFIGCLFTAPQHAHAQDESAAQKLICSKYTAETQADCMVEVILEQLPLINNARWRDQSYRDLVGVLLTQNKIDESIALFDKVQSEDVLSMVIRAVGMHLKSLQPDHEKVISYLDQLTTRASAIEHNGSKEVALTYVAISAANALESDYALKTVRSIETPSTQYKAYQEIAENLSAAGHADKALMTVQNIDNKALRNKAYANIAKIFSKNGLQDKALNAIEEIDDPYVTANTLLSILMHPPLQEHAE